MRSLTYASNWAVVALVGCSSSPQSPSPDNLGRATQPVQQVSVTTGAGDGTTSTVSNVGAAYTHKIASSRFSVGASSIEKDEYGMHKFVGDQGVFATLATGKVLSLANADAVVRQHPGPLPGGADAHNQAVRDYFVGAGLPAEQIASVDIMPAMMGTADLVKQVSSVPKLVCYFSMIRRQIGGVPVPDSYAWARINQDGALVEESVYWPQIPAAVVADAQAFAATLANNASQQAFVAALPSKKSGQLVIHHTPGEWTQTFAAAAVYDVPDDNPGFGATIHYDSTRSNLVLPHEAKGAWGPPPVMPSKTR